MAIAKVIDRLGNSLIDLTTDTVTSNKVLEGVSFHDADGNLQVGSLKRNDLDYSKYNFLDYDGELVGSFTDDEIDSLTELPPGLSHSDQSLVFQEWNYTLDELKAWNRERPDRPIVGPYYITDDEKTHILINAPYAGTLTFEISSGILSVDWGDGTVNTSTSHTYSAPGKYTVKVETTSAGYIGFTNTSTSKTSLKQYIEHIRMGKQPRIQLSLCYSLETVSISNKVTTVLNSCFQYCVNLRYLTLPKITSIPAYCFDNTRLENISIPNSVNTIPGYSFQYCHNLKRIILPDNIQTIGGYSFYNCADLEYIVIPDKVSILKTYTFYNASNLKDIIFLKNGILKTLESSSIGSTTRIKYLKIPNSIENIDSPFTNNSLTLTLDLSEQTKVIKLTSGLGGYSPSTGCKILVPENLLGDYKSDSVWSRYADTMISV